MRCANMACLEARCYSGRLPDRLRDPRLAQDVKLLADRPHPKRLALELTDRVLPLWGGFAWPRTNWQRKRPQYRPRLSMAK